MVRQPTGTVTFLFTDIEGSTSRWEQEPEAMRVALARHDEILREAIEGHRGYVFQTVGDAFCAAFSTAVDALKAAFEGQRALLGEEWDRRIGALRVRMALHSGSADERDGDYFGAPLNRVARLLSAAHGGQVLLSLPTRELVRDQLPPGTQLRDLGERRLKDLSRPQRIFQLFSPDLPSEFPPLRTLERHPTNLPLQPTPLIGREREVEQVRELLHRTEVRLLTLTGAGGTGKTRVALQAAAELLEEFEDGVFFVSLAAIKDPALVAPTIAWALGLTEASGQPPVKILEGYLRDSHILLLLDNFEQVLKAVPLLDELLSAAHRLKIMVTSRIPLRLYGEKEFAVPPLSLPNLRHPQPVERLIQYEAVRLFIERAKDVKPDFSVTNENALAVAEICARLDGLPLALELAAARIKLLPPRAMLARLGSRLKLLTGGARNLPERQRTLRATLEWSHELLDKVEKMLFARLAVFSGGSTFEAIKAICDTEGDLPVDTLDGVSSLLDNSLLRQEEGAENEPRFYMLETIHEYARERLEESGKAKELRTLHAGYFLALAEKAEPGFRGPQQGRWLDQLQHEHDNLRDSLSWAIERGEAEQRLRLAGALWPFWYAGGYFGEGRSWLEQVLMIDGHGTAAARAKVLEGLGWLAYEHGDVDRTVAAAQEGLELSAEAEIEGTRTASFLRMLGTTARLRGDYERAKELCEQSLALGRNAADKWTLAHSFLQLGHVSGDLGDSEQAITFYEQGLALSWELDSAEIISHHLISLGYEFLLRGDYQLASQFNERAAAMLRERGQRGGLQYALDNLGWAALLQGDHERAKTSFKEGLVLCKELGDRSIAAESLEGLACATGAEGEAERTVRLFGAAETLREAVGYQQTARERALREPYRAAIRSSLGGTVWEKTLVEGRAMTFDKAISYALEEETYD